MLKGAVCFGILVPPTGRLRSRRWTIGRTATRASGWRTYSLRLSITTGLHRKTKPRASFLGSKWAEILCLTNTLILVRIMFELSIHRVFLENRPVPFKQVSPFGDTMVTDSETPKGGKTKTAGRRLADERTHLFCPKRRWLKNVAHLPLQSTGNLQEFLNKRRNKLSIAACS
jgi:hypothetical protein